jgi:phosphatidylinositol alpha-mannosyltransferase
MRTPKLTIGLVLDDSLDSSDGVQQYVLAIGDWLTSRGHIVHYIAAETRRQLLHLHSLSRSVRVPFNGNRMGTPLPASRSAIRMLLRDISFDVIHVQMPYSPFLGGRIIRQLPPSCAVVGTFHILPDSKLTAYANRILARWLRPTLKRFDRVVAVSNAAQQFAEKIYQVDVTTLPNAVKLTSFTSTELTLTTDSKLRILFLGRLVERKNCQLLLAAVAILAQQGQVPLFHVDICGRGHLEPTLRKFVIDYQLGSLVTFHGYVSEIDKARYYAQADIAVFPSTGGESFGIVLIEAMANGHTAVLAGDNPGYRSVVGTLPGSLFNPYSAEGLADRLKSLLCDKPSRQSLATMQTAYAAQFDVSIVGARLESIYQEALQERKNLR